MNRRSQLTLGTLMACSVFIASAQTAQSFDWKSKIPLKMGSESKITQEQEQTKAMLNDRKLDLKDQVTTLRTRGKISQEEANRLYGELNKIGEINVKDNSVFSAGKVKAIAKRLNYVNEQIQSHKASAYQEAPQGRTSYARSWANSSSMSELSSQAESIRANIDKHVSQNLIKPAVAGKLKKQLNQITAQISKAPTTGGLDNSNLRTKMQNQLHELERQVRVAIAGEDKPLE
jgi:hypothetical protein